MTSVNYPKTSHLRLSESRRERFIFEAKDTFIRSCLSRLILIQTPFQSEGEFTKIGFNNIVDRIWFVDGVFDGASYATPSGAPYGSTVAEGETRLVLNKLIGLAREDKTSLITEITSDLNEVQVLSLLDRVRQRGYEPTAIIASTKLSLTFWDFRSFRPFQGGRRDLVTPEGYLLGIPFHHCRLLPDDAILVADKNNIGSLEVKKEFDVTVDEIGQDAERERIRREVPTLANADFDEKARILGFEIVKPIIRNNAFAFIKAGGSLLELKNYA
jgi:hypothetical protein